MSAPKPSVPAAEPVLKTRAKPGQKVDWQAAYERTAAKFPKTLKRLGE